MQNAYGNFAFTYTIDHEFYEKAYAAEQKARINYEESGAAIRKALERLIADIIHDCGLDNYVSADKRLNPKGQPLKDNDKLGLRLGILQSPREMLAAGYIQNKSEMFGVKSKAPLPGLNKVPYQKSGGAKVLGDGYTFLRDLGNTCSHGGDIKEQVVLNYAAIRDGIKLLHDIAKHHWKARCKKEGIPFGQFLEKRMPIGKYVITAAATPSDMERSKCQLEFQGYIPNDEGRPETYAILRMYRRADAEESGKNFILRNQKSYAEVRSAVPYMPQGMATNLNVVTEQSAESSEFYILAYEFPREPRVLSNDIIKDMDNRSRIKMCAQIARCLYELHHSDVPISHRMLNYECIYMCKYSSWVPFIIKFDYAKITNSSEPAKTVFMNAKEAREKLEKQAQLNKYIAPEWDALDQSSDGESWNRVDIYSLGVLISDILWGAIQPQLVDLEALEERGALEELLMMLGCMLSDDPGDRPDLGEVCGILDAYSR